MRLEMVIGMKVEILDGQSSGLISNEPFEKRPGVVVHKKKSRKESWPT